jgi:hypothetical protein
MNELSLAYSTAQKQDRLSTIDDPFYLKNNFKGVKNVKTNNNRSLSDYAEELVATYGVYKDDQYTLVLDMLSDEEQNELTRLYLESIDRDTSECIYGDEFSINNLFTCALLSMLANNCLSTRERFAQVTQTNIRIYFKKSLNDVLSRACVSYYHLQMNEHGYHAHTDLEHGDVVWGKF